MFGTDSGTAIPLANELDILGINGITTSGAGNVVTINGAGLTETLTGNSGGPVSPIASNINTIGSGSITIVGSPGTHTLTTQLTGLTAHAVLVGAGTDTITNVLPAALGTVLTSNGPGLDPSFLPASASGILTINGDSGSVSGNIVTIFANQATLNSGATVEFDNSGTISTLNVTDSHLNTFIGKNSGIKEIGSDHTGIGYSTLASITVASTLCTAIGYQALLANTSGANNSAGGASSLFNVTTGSGNTGFGRQAGTQLSTGSNNCYFGLAAGGLSGPQTGSNNTIIGANAASNWTGAESSNIYLGVVAGTTAESNKMRLGTSGSGSGQVSATFIAGVQGVTVSNPNLVTINTSTDQMGSIASANSAVLVSTSTGVPVMSTDIIVIGIHEYITSSLGDAGNISP